jgi:hypothetical protein
VTSAYRSDFVIKTEHGIRLPSSGGTLTAGAIAADRSLNSGANREGKTEAYIDCDPAAAACPPNCHWPKLTA